MEISTAVAAIEIKTALNCIKEGTCNDQKLKLKTHLMELKKRGTLQSTHSKFHWIWANLYVSFVRRITRKRWFVEQNLYSFCAWEERDFSKTGLPLVSLPLSYHSRPVEFLLFHVCWFFLHVHSLLLTIGSSVEFPIKYRTFCNWSNHVQ